MDSFYAFFSGFSGFRWQDGLDILLNTYILFRLYVLFRGTTVFRAILAICLFWAAGHGASSLGLIVTNWAMQGVIAVAALILIIVFRNEIAGVMQARELKSFFWGIPKHQFHTPIHIIVESVYELAREKIGALIVLPRNQGLKPLVQGGVPVESHLTREMLISVFWPNNPLHDGAAIVHGDRISRAGVILPLSTREDLPSSFGTRHRAAMGLTTLTDALVIVVSEERGRISLFKKNKVSNIRDRQDFEAQLQEHAGDEPGQKGMGRQTLELFTAALISLVCVTTIWFSFSKGMETFAVQEVPLEFMKPDQNMEILASSVSNAKLMISGARPLINAVRPEQIKIKLDLARCTAGANHLSITQDNILLPPGIRLKKIEPQELIINLDTLMEKQMPIQPNWVGKLPKGLVLTEARAVPAQVGVKGGALLMKKISTLFTEPIPLDRITKSGTIQVGLVPDPASLKLNRTDKIEIHYVVSERPAS